MQIVVPWASWKRVPLFKATRYTLLLAFMLPCCIVIDFFLNNQAVPLIIQILFCYKTLHVWVKPSAHHQEFSTVYSALVNFMQLLMTVSKQSQDGTRGVLS
jgi:hypothetical protein